jgi:hypothetical protein
VKRRLAALVLSLAAAAAQAQPYVMRGERVLDFASDIRIAADGGLSVTERIAVQVEGRQIRRGIVRDFPTEYRDRLGNRVSVPFEVVRVLQDGRPARWGIEQMENGVRIRIGDPGVMLARGAHVYEISYRTARQIGFFKDHDELYWNVNGSGWTFAFERASAEVTLPAAVAAGKLKLEAYAGYQGARERNYEAQARDGGASFRTTRPLQPAQGLTIVVAFPKGIVAAPSLATRARWFLEQNAGAAAGLGSLALLFAFLWWRWTLVGRDPRAGPIYPRYDAPPGLGPAGARYLDRMACDERCFAAALLGLGQRGYLRIRQHGERYDLERTGASVSWLPAENTLAFGLFPGASKRLSFGATHDPVVQAARDGFKRALERHFGERLFSKNIGSLIGGIAIAALGLAAMFVLEASIPVFVALLALMALTLFLFARWLPAYSVEGRKLQDAVEGLRQYLGVAEADDLARMKAPPQTKEEFAKFLPYAVALEVEKTWAERFAATLGAATVAAAVADYYQSDSSGGFLDSNGVGDLTDSLAGLGSTIAAAATPPGSSSGMSGDSGGGGGGSSGGGGGGGGGSGW